MAKHIFLKNNIDRHGKITGRMPVCLAEPGHGDSFVKGEGDADCPACLAHRSKSRVTKASDTSPDYVRGLKSLDSSVRSAAKSLSKDGQWTPQKIAHELKHMTNYAGQGGAVPENMAALQALKDATAKRDNAFIHVAGAELGPVYDKIDQRVKHLKSYPAHCPDCDPERQMNAFKAWVARRHILTSPVTDVDFRTARGESSYGADYPHDHHIARITDHTGRQRHFAFGRTHVPYQMEGGTTPPSKKWWDNHD